MMMVGRGELPTDRPKERKKERKSIDTCLPCLAYWGEGGGRKRERARAERGSGRHIELMGSVWSGDVMRNF